MSADDTAPSGEGAREVLSLTGHDLGKIVALTVARAQEDVFVCGRLQSVHHGWSSTHAWMVVHGMDGAEFAQQVPRQTPLVVVDEAAR